MHLAPVITKCFRSSAIAASTILCVAVLTACGSSGEAGGQSSTLVVAGFGGSFEDAQTQAVVADFEKDNNVNIELKAEDSATVMAKLKAQKADSGYDVVQFSGGQEVKAFELGLLAEMGKGEIPNAADALPQAERNDGKTPPAYAFNTTGIIYNTDRVTQPPKSWDDLGDQRYEGRVGLDDISQAAGMNLLLSLAKINGGSEKDIDPGFNAVEKILPNVHTIYEDATSMTQLMAKESIDLAVFDSGYAYLLQQKGMPVKFAIPEEGSIVYGLTANIVSGSENEALARKFINALLDANNQHKFASIAGYAPTNENVELTKKETAQIPLLDHLDTMWSYDPEVVESNRSEWTSRWNKLVAK